MMINRLNFNNTENNITFQNNHKYQMNSGIQDEFVMSKEVAQYDENDINNAVEFLSGVGFEQLTSDIIKNDNWNNGSDIVGFNKRKGKVVGVMLDIYNFQDGDYKEFSISNSEFLNILEQVKNNCIKQNSDKKDVFENLFIALSKKLK